MKIITAGPGYIDIDAYAGIIAYAELLQKQGQSAQAVSTSAPNESVTKTVRSWQVSLQTKYTPRPDDTFTMIDVSAPDFFDSFVELDRVEAIIDHHPGYESYWQERIGENAMIETVGAACTQVYECWKRADMLAEMSETCARLLICGILDNTLNFGAKITTQRDHEAYDALKQIANLPSDWPAQYFHECQAAIDKDPIGAIENDTKMVTYPTQQTVYRVGQFAVWDAAKILAAFQDDLIRHFEAQNDPWFINIISIGSQKSYFLATDPATQTWLSDLLHVSFEGSLAVADRLWLRKEIMQAAISKRTRSSLLY